MSPFDLTLQEHLPDPRTRNSFFAYFHRLDHRRGNSRFMRELTNLADSRFPVPTEHVIVTDNNFPGVKAIENVLRKKIPWRKP